MSLRDKFRIDELVKKGSKAIKRDSSDKIRVLKKDGKEVKPSQIKLKPSKPYGQEPIRGKIKEPKLKSDLIEPIEEENIEQTSFSGETSSTLERPYYNEEELKKAVDIEVDELIRDIATLETNVNSLESEVRSAQEQLRTSQAEFEALKNRFEVLLADFQNAVLKGTKEGIERVSMTAQVRGLGAQKETLASQLESEKQIVKSLQGANETLQATIESNRAIAEQQIKAANQQVQAAQATASSAANSKKKKIICVELYNQGYIPYEIYKADEDWGDMMFIKDPRLVVGYMMWSRPIVEWMKKNPNHILIDMFYHGLSKYWCAWMADQMGVKVNQKRIWIGKLIHTIFGNGFSKFVYDNFGGERRYKVLKYLEARNGN
jgi:hypothetical protein